MLEITTKFRFLDEIIINKLDYTRRVLDNTFNNLILKAPRQHYK